MIIYSNTLELTNYSSNILNAYVGVNGQPRSVPMKPFEPLRSMLEEAVTAGLAPGMALAIGRAQGPLFGHACGICDVEESAPIQPQTLFDLASLTKVLGTGLLTVQRWAAGQLDPDAPLDRLLPGYYPPDKAALTVRQLMSHCAGLPAHIPFYRDFDAQTLPPRQEVIDRIAQTPLEYPPLSRSVYSDIGPILTGDLLEKLAGDRIDRLCDRQLYRPLGLADTFFVADSDPLPQAARPPSAFAATEVCPWRGCTVRGRVHDENAYLLGGVAGHAGLFSTVQDVEKLAQTLLADLQGAEVLLPARFLAASTQRQRLVADSARALAWEAARPEASCGSHCSTSGFGHTGFTGTSLWIDPQRDLYIALLANRVHPSRSNSDFIGFRPRLHDRAFELADQI